MRRSYTASRLLCAGLLLLAVTGLHAQTLVWEDNFDGTTINSNNWTFDFGDGCERGLCGWGNSELQYYTSRTDNARIESGSLVLEAKRENFLGKEFTSARLKTEGRMHFTYGTLEARIKIPNLANGLWPAYWMLGTTGNWPASGEIDMMEMGSAAAISAGVINKRAGAAVHWDYQGSYASYGQDYNSTTDIAGGDYHVYKLTWDPQFVRVYIDNVQYFSFDITAGASNSLEEFHIPHYLLLNLAVGGTYTGIFGSSGITAPLPGKMYVDYIRLYQNSGSSLYLGSNNAIGGTYGVFTETTPVTGSLAYGTDANLYLWNNLNTLAGSAYEGSQVLSYRANAGSWFGMGIANTHKNLSSFSGGNLKFHMKTSSTHTFRVGISTAFGDSWVTFANGGQQYGLVRDGNWHEVTIPFSAFLNLDLYSVKQIFMLVGDAPAANMDFAIDNIYYSGGGGTNAAPSVSITAPAANASFTQGQSVTISANASDSDGSITKVAFYANGSLLGEDTSSPYSYPWTNAGAGTHSLTAIATDNGGATKTSTAVSITVTASNTPPTVSLTAPAANASFTQGQTITISANASDNNGSVTKVAFYANGSLLGEDTSSPYSYAWTNAGTGTQSLTAIATDNGGLTQTSAAVSITVTAAATNLALNKTTTVSSVENAGLPGSAAVDGSGTTRWSSAFSDPQWIYVDLGASYAVNRVKITWEAAYGKDYLVQISSDASTWTTLKTVTNNAALTNDHTGLSGTGRYVRIYGTARGTVYGYSIYELEVYGTASTGGVCTGSVANGDYSYEVSTTSGTVNWKFIPLTPIQGSTLCILYVKVGSGAYAGYPMTASGSNFVYSQAQTSGAALSFYFTYRIGNTTAERNSSATPHAYTVGATCSSRPAGQAAPAAVEQPISLAPNPVQQELTIEGVEVSSARIFDLSGREVIRQSLSNNRVDVSALRPGVYFLEMETAEGQIRQRFIKQ